jgi:hypothetical protein
MGKSRNARSLGVYVLTVAAMQLTLYVVMTPKSASWLFYFDPRIGLSFWQSAVTRTESFPAVAAWVATPSEHAAKSRMSVLGFFLFPLTGKEHAYDFEYARSDC